METIVLEKNIYLAIANIGKMFVKFLINKNLACLDVKICKYFKSF